jgi:hypothetical protein
MRFPCTLCDSLAHFTYRCPLIVAYRGHHSTPIQPHLTTSPLVLHSLDTVNITSPEPESLPIPPWFTDRLSEDIPPNPPNSLVNFPQEILPPTTVYHPQCLDIWFMSSEPSHPVCDIPSTSSPLEDNHTLTIPLSPPRIPCILAFSTATKISWRNSLPLISHGMCSITEHFFSHRRPFTLLAKPPYVQSKPRILFLQGI